MSSFPLQAVGTVSTLAAAVLGSGSMSGSFRAGREGWRNRSPPASLYPEYSSWPRLQYFSKGEEYKIMAKSGLGGMWGPEEERVRETLFQPEG